MQCNSIGKRIKAARKAAGLTQVELANKVNLSRSHIGAIETDRYNPSLSTLEAISKATNCPLPVLLEENLMEVIQPNGVVNVYQREEDDTPPYYHDPEVAEIAQAMHDTPGMRVMFDASRKLSKESIEEVQNFIKFQLSKEGKL